MTYFKARRGDFYISQQPILMVYGNRKFISSRLGNESNLSEIHVVRNEAWEPY